MKCFREHGTLTEVNKLVRNKSVQFNEINLDSVIEYNDKILTTTV